jgi:hypothetical protein
MPYSWCELKKPMLTELHKINRKDLWAKPECLTYWREEEEPTVEGCIKYLLIKYPNKKVYSKKIVADPFRD